MSPEEFERTKLTATFLNTLASGIILAAVVAPYISAGLGITEIHGEFWNILGFSGFGFTVGLMLHFFARRVFRVR
jgi:hypothetical protein